MNFSDALDVVSNQDKLYRAAKKEEVGDNSQFLQLGFLDNDKMLT